MRLSKVLLFLSFFIWASQVNAQKYTISGYISDVSSGERLIGGTIYDLSVNQGSVSNTYGFYSLTLPSDTVVLTVSYVGYEPGIASFYLDKDTTLNFRLSSLNQLTEVVISAEQNDRLEEQSQMSKIDLPIEQIKQLPALLGETDVLKSLQLLPGVQSGGEGQDGLYVRGGSPDQNLILLDGVPVYNVSHLLGFFSVFNADAIKKVTLTKGGFPARYGGRLSSVVDIAMKEGNDQEFHGEGSVGVVAAKLTLEGPIIKGKSSFMISGRRTYIDAFARPLIKSSQEPGQRFDPTLYFYDFNAKLNYTLASNHKLYLSSYLGSDVFQFRSTETYDNGDSFKLDGGTDWGNLTTALRWNWQVNQRMFSNTTLIYSKYRFDFLSSVEDRYDGEVDAFSAKYFSGINDIGIRNQIDFIPNPQNYLRAGFSVVRHQYDPGAFQLKATASEIELDTTLGSQKLYSTEMSLFLEDDIDMGNFKLNVGLHGSAFAVEETFYTSVEPRLSMRYLMSNRLSLKGSFAMMTQYINLLTNESLSLPTDLWVPSTDRIKPQRSMQIAIGAVKSIAGGFEVSLEGYYKSMRNVISYLEGADFIGLDQDWQNKVTQGEGKSYGIEFFLQKKTGRLSGWLGYTLSKNTRTFDAINAGDTYPFKYDRRHDISLYGNYQLSERIIFNGVWIYGTGNSISLPLFQYVSPFEVFDDYFIYRDIETVGKKNAFRMPSYHRFDFSVEFRKKKKRFERSWILGAYNTYNHRNPYFIYAGRNDAGEKSFKQVSLFPIIPSVTYRFKF